MAAMLQTRALAWEVRAEAWGRWIMSKGLSHGSGLHLIPGREKGEKEHEVWLAPPKTGEELGSQVVSGSSEFPFFIETQSEPVLVQSSGGKVWGLRDRVEATRTLSWEARKGYPGDRTRRLRLEA